MSQGVSAIGLGVCTPVGSTLATMWDGLLDGRSVARRRTFDFGAPTEVVLCEIDDLPIDGVMPRHELRRLDRHHRVAVSAAESAIGQAWYDVEAGRRAVCVGTGYGAGPGLDEQTEILRSRGVRSISPLTLPLAMPNSVAAHLALRYQATGPVTTYATACASGATAIGEALALLRADRADVVLAGGVDAIVFPTPIAGFARLGALCGAADGARSRPFDRDRSGFVISEGAGFLVLVRDEDAGHDGLGRVLGYGATTDAIHIVAPDESGGGAARSIESALRDADLGPGDVGHVNAHGTSTLLNDLAESRAIAAVFGPDGPPVIAPKGVTGHMIGGSGAVEAIASILACRHRTGPAIGGLEHLGDGIDIDVVTGGHRPLRNGVGVSNSFAFGGHNAALVVSS